MKTKIIKLITKYDAQISAFTLTTLFMSLLWFIIIKIIAQAF